ncbi:hypothetical protein FGIG_11518 [Fasciola gigantica]|uniref:Uncharacterized protein n=1 Tax=Fasciola gigantica TaxID=46835 RepID=A0A504Z540_FASGI|nr:hypothetical protein FGIG_11518 [Fasciola gigantica]
MSFIQSWKPLEKNERQLQAPEYRASIGPSECMFPLTSSEEGNESERNWYKEENRAKLDSVLASFLGDNAGRYVQSLMPRLVKNKLPRISIIPRHMTNTLSGKQPSIISLTTGLLNSLHSILQRS